MVPRDKLAAYVHKCCHHCTRQIALVWRLPNSSGSPQFFGEERRDRVSSYFLYNPWLDCKNWKISHSKTSQCYLIQKILISSLRNSLFIHFDLFSFWLVALYCCGERLDICVVHVTPLQKFSIKNFFLKSYPYIHVTPLQKFSIKNFFLKSYPYIHGNPLNICIVQIQVFEYDIFLTCENPRGRYKKENKKLFVRHYLQNARKISTSTPENSVALLLIMFNIWVL